MAFIDADEDTRFEIGSVTKGLVGMLLAEAISQGEADLDTTVAALLPETKGSRVGSVTVQELATHISGLPRLPRTPATVVRMIVGGYFYWGAILAARNARVRLVPVPNGPEGPDPAALARAFEVTGARVFYAQPHYANPTGAQWSRERGAEVLEVVRDHGAFLVEDDWAHDFGIDTTPVPIAARDDSGHAIYIRSLTKSVSPAIRVAAIIARGPARERILDDRGAETMYVSGILQAAALDVVTAPGWQTHLRILRHQLQSRRDLLAASIREHAPQAHIENIPKGGLHLWLRLPDGTNLDKLTRECEDGGVIITAGSEWFPAEPAGPFIRLNCSGPNPSAYHQGARILGQALKHSYQ